MREDATALYLAASHTSANSSACISLRSGAAAFHPPLASGSRSQSAGLLLQTAYPQAVRYCSMLFADCSAECATLLLPAAPAALPVTLGDLRAYLRDRGQQRIPVTREFFQVRNE